MDVMKNTSNGHENGHGSAQGTSTAMTAEGTSQRPSRATERLRVVTPAIDVLDNEESILVLLDVPGVATEDVVLRFEKDELLVQAKRAGSNGGWEYRRALGVPSDVDGEGISASLARGVLTLTLPRKASAKPRTIQVRSA